MGGNVKSKIPEWRRPAVDIPVQDLREFIARYGPSVAVLVTWTEATKKHQFVTIGSDVGFANAAVRLRNLIANKMGLEKLDQTTEDLRGDHPNVSLNVDQLDFLLWLLGYIYADKNMMDAGHKVFVQKYHDQLLPIFGDAKEEIVNKPV